MKLPARLVAIIWTDAFDSDNGWITVRDYKPKPQRVVTVGYLWEDALEDHISVTSSWCFEDDDGRTEADEVGMVTHIPSGMVNQLVYLPDPAFSVSGSASEQTRRYQQHPTTPLSPALDYPPYEATTPHATNLPKAHPR
jgi:hypothetical protein